MFQRFVEINHHDNACLNGGAEESNVTDPHRHAEVVMEQPLQQQSACHGVDGWYDQHHSLGSRTKDHVQQQKDEAEDYRKNELETLFGTQLKLIFPRPLEAIVCRQCNLMVQPTGCLLHEAAVVGVFEVDVDVSGELAVLIADHGRAM